MKALGGKFEKKTMEVEGQNSLNAFQILPTSIYTGYNRQTCNNTKVPLMKCNRTFIQLFSYMITHK